VRAWLVAFVFLAACGPSPEQHVQKDPTTEAWYTKTVTDLTAIARQAKDLFEKGKADDAAALIEKGEPLSAKLLAVRNPTLPAVQAASDLDQLYGQMLFSNHNYGWARLMFQKNLARWKNWTPQTPDTAARLQAAQTAIALCDTKILQ
jgi:hypothetical protein